MQQYLEQILRETQSSLREDQKYCIDQYIDFINDCIKQDLDYEHNHITERHYIVSVSWQKEFEKDKNNLVVLTLDQHIIAHGLLAKTEHQFALSSMWGMLATRRANSLTLDQRIDRLANNLQNLDKKYDIDLNESEN